MSAVSLEQYESLPQPLSVEAILREVRDYSDSGEQFCALSQESIYLASHRLPREIDSEDFDALIDFAADTTSSPSLLVRARALETAVELAQSTLRMREDMDLSARYKQVLTLIPELESRRVYIMRSPHMASEGERHDFVEAGHYRHTVAQLAEREGIPKEYIFPVWDSYSGDPLFMPDYNPTHAFLLLERLADQEQTNLLPISPLTKLVPLVLAMQQGLAQGDPFKVSDERAGYLSQVSKLTRVLEIGDDYAEQIENFLRADTRESESYTRVLNVLYDSASLLGDVFPSEFGVGVAHGVRELVANSLYALYEYARQGEACNVGIPLNGDSAKTLPLRLSKGEPLYLLESLALAIRQLHEAVTAETTRTVPVNKTGDYKLYRLISKSRANVSVYIRPIGAVNYDPVLEYGRPGEGVEASISYVVDPYLPGKELLALGKRPKAEADNRISLRLDREGIQRSMRSQPTAHRDPTREEGTLSLDVGSVLGNESWLGTRIGRFLAWGSTLRSNALHQDNGLNHVIHHFSEQAGRADFFAIAASEAGRRFASRRMRQREVVRRFSGELGLRAGN